MIKFNKKVKRMKAGYSDNTYFWGLGDISYYEGRYSATSIVILRGQFYGNAYGDMEDKNKAYLKIGCQAYSDIVEAVECKEVVEIYNWIYFNNRFFDKEDAEIIYLMCLFEDQYQNDLDGILACVPFRIVTEVSVDE